MAAPMKKVVQHLYRKKSYCYAVLSQIQGHRFLGTTSVTQEKGSLAQEFKKVSQIYHTTEDNPVKQTDRHHGMYYTVSDRDWERWFSQGFPTHFNRLVKAFNEKKVMIRRPALEIFTCLRASNMSLPVIRYLLYGRHGAGKTMTLTHVMHHCGSQDWLVVHIPWAPYYNLYIKERQTNTHNPDRCDSPLEAAEWLGYFQLMNEEILTKLDLRVQNKYTWTRRDVTEPGTPWLELIEYGLTRVKYSCDVMGALLKEIRLQSSQGKCRTLVAIEGVNALWKPTVIKRLDDPRYKYEPGELTVFHNLRKMVANDWSGGAVVCTVDNMALRPEERTSYLPRKLLHKDGLALFEPHIPIHIGEYDDKEFESCLQYYVSKKWIQRPEGLTEEGRKELEFLSCKNPLEFHNITARW